MATSANSERIRLAKQALLGRLVPDLVHQLRNPLNSILTSVELLAEQGDNEQLRGTLLPVVSRSAARIRDLLRSLDGSIDADLARVFELRSALEDAQALLQCRRHTVVIQPSAKGSALVIKGDYEPLWILLLSVLEETLCAAKHSVRIEVREDEEHVGVAFVHDGEPNEKSSGFEREFVLSLAPALGAEVYYDGPARSTMLRFPGAMRQPEEI